MGWVELPQIGVYACPRWICEYGVNIIEVFRPKWSKCWFVWINNVPVVINNIARRFRTYDSAFRFVSSFFEKHPKNIKINLSI